MSTNYDPDFCPCCPGVLLYGDPCPFCGDDCPDCQPVAASEPLRVVCAWCADFDATDPANLGASHGLCASCEARVSAEWDAAPVRDASGRFVAPPQSAPEPRVTMAYPMREGM